MSDPLSHLGALAARGDREAASQLVTQFYPRLFGWLRRLTGHDEDAADLTQKTFIRFWQSLATFQARSSLSTWLHGIGYHVYQDWRRQRPDHERFPDEWWAEQPDDAPSPSSHAAQRDSASHLYHLVDQLDEDTRQTVHLHYYEGLSLAETAEVLGVAASTVKYRLRQAIDSLRSQIAEPKHP